jgi:ribonuclease HI
MIEMYTDGGARGNPGPAGAGIVVKKEGSLLFSSSSYLGVKTNNEAEYLALILGLELCFRQKIVLDKIFMDSELIVKQLNKEYKVKNLRLKSLYDKVLPLLGSAQVIHIKRNLNKEADFLVNQILDIANE